MAGADSRHLVTQKNKPQGRSSCGLLLSGGRERARDVPLGCAGRDYSASRPGVRLEEPKISISGMRRWPLVVSPWWVLSCSPIKTMAVD